MRLCVAWHGGELCGLQGMSSSSSRADRYLLRYTRISRVGASAPSAMPESCSASSRSSSSSSPVASESSADSPSTPACALARCPTRNRYKTHDACRMRNRWTNAARGKHRPRVSTPQPQPPSVRRRDQLAVQPTGRGPPLCYGPNGSLSRTACGWACGVYSMASCAARS